MNTIDTPFNQKSFKTHDPLCGDISMEITVITPVYNAEKFLQQCVESAIQFDEVKEVLLIEDGSPDNALALCNHLEKEYPKVRLLQHPDKKNHGASASRNLGIQHARYPFIAFLDADDFFLPNRFDGDKKAFAENEDADGVYNALGVHFHGIEAEKVFRQTHLKEITTVTQKTDPTGLFLSLIGLAPWIGYFSLDTLTIKKEALQRMDYWFNPSLNMHEDSEFIRRLAYYARLYPGETEKPVAKRGVHEENRITKNNLQKDTARRKRRQYHLSLYQWAKTHSIEYNYQAKIYHNYLEACIKTDGYLSVFLLFIQGIIRHKSLLFQTPYYHSLHRYLFGTGRFSVLIKKITDRFQKKETHE